MKRFFILLLVLCTFASTAFGETIAQRVDAPETVSIPAITPGKEGTLAFEAKVVVPDVEKVPILQVKIDEISEERIFAAADIQGLTDINRKPSAWDFDTFKNGGKTKTYEGYSSGWKQFYAWVSRDCEEAPDAVTFSTLYQNEFKKAEYYIGQMQAKPYPDVPREGIMTRDAAHSLAQKTIGAFTQGYAYTLEKDGALGGTAQLTDAEMYALNKGKKDPASVPKFPYAFAFYFAPVFEGIPVTQTDSTGRWSNQADKESLASIGYESSVAIQSSLQVVVLDAGVHAMEWRDPLSVIGILQEDSQLLPFTDILTKGTEALKQCCMREDERNAEGEGLICDFVITEIRFGYLCKQMEPDSMDLRLVPVWDFMGHENWTRGDEMGTMHENIGHAFVTLSAEDGSILYREDTEVIPMNKGVVK